MPQVSRSNQRLEAPLGGRKLSATGQFALAGGFAHPIDVEDQLPLTRPIRSHRPPIASRVHLQVVDACRKSAQRLQTRAVHRREKATQGTSIRQLSLLKERQKGGSKRLQPVKEHLQGPFATECRAKQRREKIEDLVPTKASPPQAHPRAKGLQESMIAYMAGDEDEFGKPRGIDGCGSSVVWMSTQGCGTVPMTTSGKETLRRVSSYWRLISWLCYKVLFPSMYLVAHPVGPTGSSSTFLRRLRHQMR